MTASLHLYAVLDRRPGQPLLRGAFGEPVLEVEASSVVAVVGAVESPPSDDRVAALAHARVVEELALRAPAVLPSRFGVRFDGVDSLREAVEAEAAGLNAALAGVRGCVEVALTAVFPTPEDASPPGTGSEYLRRRVAETRRVDALVSAVHRPLERLARDARLTHGIAPLRFSASYLIPREDVDAFTAAVDGAAADVDVELVRGGPWPAYSFATGGAAG